MARDRNGLSDIRIKLERAEKHLHEALAALANYRRGECTITMEKDEELQMAVQRICLAPSASPEISAIAGDFFANIRSVLDYTVWQLVLNNPPNEPGPSNQFPITNSPEKFSDQIGRKRLRGVSEEAATVIETLQPYRDRDNPLGILDKLVNIDKHRTLNVVSVVADNTEVVSQSGEFSLVLGDEELRDGEVFGGIGIPFNMLPMLPGFEARLPRMMMRGECSLFLAFDDPTAERLEEFRVDATLQRIYEFVASEALPKLDRFLFARPTVNESRPDSH
jgi:hypothetical protein